EVLPLWVQGPQHVLQQPAALPVGRIRLLGPRGVVQGVLAPERSSLAACRELFQGELPQRREHGEARLPIHLPLLYQTLVDKGTQAEEHARRAVLVANRLGSV